MWKSRLNPTDRTHWVLANTWRNRREGRARTIVRPADPRWIRWWSVPGRGDRAVSLPTPCSVTTLAQGGGSIASPGKALCVETARPMRALLCGMVSMPGLHACCENLCIDTSAGCLFGQGACLTCLLYVRDVQVLPEQSSMFFLEVLFCRRSELA